MSAFEMLAFSHFIKFYNEGEITMVSIRKRGKVYEYRFEIALTNMANPANPEAHYCPTGPEIWQDTEKNLDVLVCMAGTGFGTARYLREQNPALKIVLVQPHPESRLTAEHPDVPIIDGVLPVYGVPESELSDYLRPEGLFLFIQALGKCVKSVLHIAAI